jgi:VWFA-related protein
MMESPHRLRCRPLAPAIALFVGAATMATMSAQQGPTFRSGTLVVSLFTTVTDTENRLVPNLTQADFEVLDNDKPQPLTVFREEHLPIRVVLMLDTSASLTASISLVKTAAEQFIIRLLPEDSATVGAFNDKVEIGASLTNNRDQLITDVRDLDYGNGTRLFDAIHEGLDVLRTIEGRRVIVVLTDGDDTASRVGRGRILERARAEEVMIYGIGLQSEYFDGQRVVRSSPDSGLRRLADETGGGYFELKKTADLGPTFTRVAQELHSQYVLGFEAPQLDGKVHKLTVKMKQSRMTARSRKSYLAASGS